MKAKSFYYAIVILFILFTTSREAMATGSYTVDSIGFSPYPYAGTSAGLSVDDGWSNAYPIGFNFTFYGTTYTQVVIGSNGQLTFNTNIANQTEQYVQYAADSLPLADSLLPSNTINAAFRDINPYCGGNITYALYGTAPNRYFVVTWDSVPLYSTSTCDSGVCTNIPLSTFQAVLYENCSNIEVYIANSSSCPGWNQGLGFVGLIDNTGHIPVSPPQRSNGTWTAVNEAWRFAPDYGSCAVFTAGHDQDICAGMTVDMLAGGVGVWSALSSNPAATTIVSPGSPTTVITGFAYGGTYLFAWTDSIHHSDTTAVIVTAGPIANAGPDLSFCLPDSPVVLGGSPTASGGSGHYTYQWSPAPDLLNPQAANPTITITGSNQFHVVVTDSLTGCKTADTMTLTQYAHFTPVISRHGDSIMIPGSSLRLTVFAPLGGSYQWSPLTGMAPAAGDTDAVTVTAATTGPISYCVVYTEGACVNTACQQLDVVPVYAGPDQLQHICLYDSVVMAALGTGTWTAPASNPGSAAIDSIHSPATGIKNFTQSGLYSFIWTTTGGSDTVHVYVNPQPAIVLDSLNNARCLYGTGGNISVHATGGTGTIAYSWSGYGLTSPDSNSISYLAPGQYCISVRDSLFCTNSDCYTITSPPDIVVADSVRNVTCNGLGNGYICIANTTGGYPPYRYLWSNTDTGSCITNLSPGSNYSLTITDSIGCLGYRSFNITQPGALSVYQDSVYLVTCQGGNDGHICMVATGGYPPYTHHWNNGDAGACISNLGPGTYMDTITDAHGCSIVSSYILNPPSANIVLTWYITDVRCSGGSTGHILLSPAGGTPPYTYHWSTGATSDSVTALAAGSYCVSVADHNGCYSYGCNTINQPATGTTITTDSIHGAGCAAADGSIYISVSGGAVPYGYSWMPGPQSTSELDTALSAGVYCVTVTDHNGCMTEACDTVPSSDGCVWPGDADDNHVVDNNDLLPIGLGYDSTGPVRTVQGVVWQADAAALWTDHFTNYAPAVNFNNADCNGDGIINSDDTLAITTNFGSVHAKASDIPAPWRSGVPALYVIPSADTLRDGGTLTVSFALGDAGLPVNDFYGIAFTYNFDPLVVDSAYTDISYSSSWIGTSTDKISFKKIINNSGQIKTAVTRINHTGITGNGTIATATFKINTVNIQGQNMYKNIGYISAITAVAPDGSPITFNDGRDTTLINTSPLGINEVSAGKIYVLPNPAHDRITVSADNIITEIAATNVIGQNVMRMADVNTRSMSIDISAWSDGIYMIQVATDKGTGIVKLVVER